MAAAEGARLNREPIPGTFSPGFTEAALVSIPGPRRRELDVRGLVYWGMGECGVTRFRDSDGLHMSVSHPSRLPTWDEIKVARYRLLPLDRWYGLLLPPPADYVDRRDAPYIMELTEVEL